jgi:hypothetical protein
MANVPQVAGPDSQGRIRLESWSWKGAFACVFLVMVFFWGLGVGIRKWQLAPEENSTLKMVSVISGVAAGIIFLLISWRRVMEFFLSIRVGIAILVFFTLGSIAAVLVHPREPEKYNHLPGDKQEVAHRDDFFWATGYFLYHCLHPYGFGMPDAQAPASARENLQRVALRFGERLAKQEESGMKTAMSGQLRAQEIKEFIARNRSLLNTLYDICRFTQLNGTATGKGAWSSDWFAALMGLLFLIVLTNTFRRGIARAIAQGSPGLGFLPVLPSALLWDLKTLVTLGRIGFFTTHLGVLTSLVGGFHSRLTERRGIVQLSIFPERENQPIESYRYMTYSGEPLFFGSPSDAFAVRLSNFRADYRDTLEVRFLQDPPPRTVPRFSHFELWKGRQFGLEYDERGKGDPKTIVRVLEHWPRATVDLDLAERTEGEAPTSLLESAGAALRVAFDYRGMQQSGFLVSGLEGLSIFDSTPGLRVRYEAAASEQEQIRKLEAPFEGDRYGTLQIITSDNTARAAATGEIARGSSFTFKTPEGDATVKILRALPDARLIPTPGGELQPAFADVPPEDRAPLYPGVELDIYNPKGERVLRRWYYENETHSIHNDNNIFDIGGTRAKFVIRWDHWRSPARERYRIVSAPGRPLMVTRVGESGAREVKLQEIVKLSNGLSFIVMRRAENPKLVPVIQQKPGAVDDEGYFFDNSPPAARIEVDGPEGKQQFLIAASDFADVATYAHRIQIRIFENDMEMPREWKSKLEFLKPDLAAKTWKVVDTQTIRVNDYAYFQGYRFFQTDANKQLPGYSGVGVVYDPGIETVITGLWAVVIGVAYVFFVKPWLVKKAA